mmetsp:Transcript_19886/g.44903  ORF Transcript_19886/g.44903 Transcript_19886/m.44903 type:complete len:510 (+) Transcript_19886:45-1574(+)
MATSNSNSSKVCPVKYVDHTYHDYSRFLVDGGELPKTKKGHRNFPAKIHLMISEVRNNDVITWMPHGRAFKVQNKEALVARVIPNYFVCGKYDSFTRQLNGWGFRRLYQCGPDAGCFYHECFLRDLPELTCMIRRVPPNQGKSIPHAAGEPSEIGLKLTGYCNSSDSSSLFVPFFQDFYTISEKFPVPPPDMKRKQIVRESIQPILPPLKRKAAPSRQMSVPTKPTISAPQIINGRSASEPAVSRSPLEGDDRLLDAKPAGAIHGPTRSNKRLHRTATFPPRQIDRSLSCSDTSRFHPHHPQAMRPGNLYRSQSLEPSFTYPPPPPPYAAHMVPKTLSAVPEYSNYYPGENYPRPPSHYYPRYHYPPPPGMTPPPTFEHPSVVSPSSQFRPIEDGRPCDPNPNGRNDEQIDVQPDDPFAPIPYFSPNKTERKVHGEFTDTSKATKDDQDDTSHRNEPYFESGDSKSNDGTEIKVKATCVIAKTQEVDEVNAGMSEKDRLAWLGDVAMFE